jgi:signal transduction histidine kinase
VSKGDPRPVVFSEACLEQVMENLISNAEKYSPASEPIIVEIERDPHELRVRVLDRGPGIKAGDAAKLFDPFYRADATRTRAAGLGIGLAVCKRLIESQDGRIWALGRPERGAEFGFALPIIDEPDD